MEITLNGRSEMVRDGTTVRDLLSDRSVNPDAVVVEINLDIIPKGSYGEKEIFAGDTVEILRFVGGG